MSNTASNAPVLAADGTPLKQALAAALFRNRMRALMLVMPLLIFLVVTFVVPIGYFLSFGFHDDIFSRIMPKTTEALEDWNGTTEPTEDMYAALVADMVAARKNKTIGQAATRVNRELSGTRSLFTSSARKAAKLKPPYKEALIKVKKKWAEQAVWQAMKVSSKEWTLSYYANALDYKQLADGSFVEQPETRQIHVQLLVKTLWISLQVTLYCLILGYPIAYLMSNLPARTSNLLMILVLLPFWTSILVRTTAWIAMLQSQGVLNDLFVFFGITDDGSRYSMIYNKLGTLIAMTHILLPFMVLPLYSVMRGIPPSYVRAAKSMGATNWTTFWRIYAPQTIPGIGAGAILVFIVAIGYYITPALVGGQDGQMISNVIAFHMKSSLNWNLAAALGGVLLLVVMVLYAIYDRVVGIDNMKLG